MTEIKRYEMEKEYSLDINVIPVEEHDGSFVRYDDHAAIVAALQEQVRALAADNSIQDFIISAVKDLVRESEGVAGWHLNGDIAGWDEVLPELNHSETPTTDAALREIRAQAVEGFGVTLGAGESNLSILLKKCADDYAARIRSGEQP